MALYIIIFTILEYSQTWFKSKPKAQESPHFLWKELSELICSSLSKQCIYILKRTKGYDLIIFLENSILSKGDRFAWTGNHHHIDGEELPQVTGYKWSILKDIWNLIQYYFSKYLIRRMSLGENMVEAVTCLTCPFRSYISILMLYRFLSWVSQILLLSRSSGTL